MSVSHEHKLQLSNSHNIVYSSRVPFSRSRSVLQASNRIYCSNFIASWIVGILPDYLESLLGSEL
jgi:hypothetical protein